MIGKSLTISDDQRTFDEVLEDPRTVGEAALGLWLSLQDVNGDPAEVERLITSASKRVDPVTFASISAAALTLTFSRTWPAVLRQFAALGVSGGEVADRLTADLMTDVGDFLRSDVTVEEATRGA